MKILIDNKYRDVNFWSFLKCHVLSQLILLGIVYGAIGFLYMLWS
jgi:hypothetical protein